ncbi:hypothetical protein I5168_12085 [Nonlabens sp. SCSIO 43208]|uniref:hypothetical protein n=1 Tax=Nonlabens sp. SCSIO 43208 TaxID=2793009 RepID=UPI003D6B38F0
MSQVIKMTFDVKVAKDVGTDAAIVLSNIQYWVFKNAANDKNFHDGKYWTYNSVRAFTEIFEWLSTRQIRTCIDKLTQRGYLLEGEYNKDNRDRTKWYTTTDQFTTLPKSKMQLTKLTSPLDKKVNSYKEQIINTDNKLYTQPSSENLDVIPDSASNFLRTKYPTLFTDAMQKAPQHVREDMKKLLADYDAKVLKEDIEYVPKKLYGRLIGLINNWKVDTVVNAAAPKRKLLQ